MICDLIRTLEVSKSNSTLPRPPHLVDTYGAEPPVGVSCGTTIQYENAMPYSWAGRQKLTGFRRTQKMP